MENKKQFEALPKPPAGEYAFAVKRAGIKDGAVWFVIGNEQYDLLQFADLRRNALFTNSHCVLAGIIAETGGYCGTPQDLVGRAVQVRVAVQGNYVKIMDVRAKDEQELLEIVD